MPVSSRAEVFEEAVVGSYHVNSRTVRRGFLLGLDVETGRAHPHRKLLLLERLERLVSVFAVECLDVSVLDSSFDLIVRNRPDLVATWSDREVAERWLRLHRWEVTLRPEPSWEAVQALVENEPKLRKIRQRMSSISWFMAYLKEPLARRFNLEDGVDGHFWAERFGGFRLRDEVSLLACSSYVALNPVLAEEAERVETSEFSSWTLRSADEDAPDATRSRSGWLAPLTVGGDGIRGAEAGRRPADDGFLRLAWGGYRDVVLELEERELAERAGRERADRLPAPLIALGITSAAWEAAVRVTRRRFERHWARAARLRSERRRRNTS